MTSARTCHRAIRRLDGRVLVIGGLGKTYYPTDDPAAWVRSAEIYSPVTGTWSTTGSMSTLRYSDDCRDGPSPTLLSDGRVVVAGGRAANVSFASTEVYDPATGNWSITGSMTTSRYGYAAVTLLDGRVLVSGGYHSLA